MIQPSRVTPTRSGRLEATGALTHSLWSPQMTAGWAGESRPSPVIPLGKGEYSLRELRCSPNPPDC
jgi:hypothetical protein